ncbi:MAG: EAL domain-containing protein [Ancalomicrobiaceae bacterium]|nr:EAL domain-containing protein [Ancalomicrobiaceae bacterium]
MQLNGTLKGFPLRLKVILGAALLTAATAGLGIVSLHYTEQVASTAKITTELTSPMLAGAVQVSETAKRIGIRLREAIQTCSASGVTNYPTAAADNAVFTTQVETLKGLIVGSGHQDLAIQLTTDSAALTPVAELIEESCAERHRMTWNLRETTDSAHQVAALIQNTTDYLAYVLETDLSNSEAYARTAIDSSGIGDKGADQMLLTTVQETWPMLRTVYKIRALSQLFAVGVDRLSNAYTTSDLASYAGEQRRLLKQMQGFVSALAPRLQRRFDQQHRHDNSLIADDMVRLTGHTFGGGGIEGQRLQLMKNGEALHRLSDFVESADQHFAEFISRLESEAKAADVTARAQMESAINEAYTFQTAGLIAFAAGSLLIALVMAGVVSRPLEQLTAHVDQINVNGTIDDRIPAGLSRRRDEIGALAQAFGDLLSSLAEARRQLLADTQRQLRTQAERLSTAIEAMPLGLYLLDADGRLLIANRRIMDMYGLGSEDVAIGTPVGTLLARRTENGFGIVDAPPDAFRSRVVRSSNITRTVEQLVDGRVMVVTVAPTPEDGSVVIHEDVTERRRAEAQIEHMAHHDVLTGLPNRAQFQTVITSAFERLSEGSQIAILFVDLDQFKPVNDTLGHAIGDRLLVAVAKRLRKILGDGDHIARLGGDEFALLLDNNPRPEQAAALAERLVAELSQPFDVDGHHVAIGASVGISFGPTDGIEADQLIKNADLALYRAKREGRGTHRFFEAEMDRQMQVYRALEMDLRKAVVSNELEIYYQPLVGLEGNNIEGFEALLRWRHPIRGFVAPAEFIPLAEESGLIGQIGAWVLKQACIDALAWPAEVRVAVNVSPVQFRCRALVLDIVAALGASNLDPQRLELEITEGVLLNDTTTTLETLNQIRALGVRVVMDDFGTGYSSLGYLRKFTFDKVKIDQTFVRDLDRTMDSLAIIRAVNGLCDSLGIPTTAEGVETEEQLQALRKEGCRQAQGFLFSRALPLSAAQDLITRFSPKVSPGADAPATSADAPDVGKSAGGAAA